MVGHVITRKTLHEQKPSSRPHPLFRSPGFSFTTSRRRVNSGCGALLGCAAKQDGAKATGDASLREALREQIGVDCLVEMISQALQSESQPSAPQLRASS